MLWRPLLVVLWLDAALDAVLGGDVSWHCRAYGGCYPKAATPATPQRDYPYLPAPPGKTPRCARPGATFCETADHYPAHLVQFLIDRWAFDFNTLLKSEAEEDFNFRYPVTYGPYGPSLTQNNALLSGEAAANGSLQGSPGYRPSPTYGPPTETAGYPDRRYPLDVSKTAITYPPPGQQGQPASLAQSPSQQWWTRSPSESLSPGASVRGRRQSSDAPGTTTLCPTSKRFVAPQAALNTQGNWMFVANVPEADQQRYTQLVRAETCISSECDGLCSLPNGYTSRCEQQYVQKRLVALGGGGDRLYTDVFWLPHCCVCQISPVAAAAAGG